MCGKIFICSWNVTTCIRKYKHATIHAKYNHIIWFQEAYIKKGQNEFIGIKTFWPKLCSFSQMGKNGVMGNLPLEFRKINPNKEL